MFNPNIPVPGPPGRDPIVIDDDESSDEGMNTDYPGRQNRPHGLGPRYDPDMNRMRGSLSNYHTTVEQEKKVRSRLREERHAALCVLMDRELLTMQALAAQETLPQARRRFLSKLIAPEDPNVAASIRSDIFIVQNASSPSASSNAPLVVHRSVVDVHETDDAGWRRPVDAGGSSSAFASPASSSKNKGRLSTPDRMRGKAKGSTASSSVSGSAGRGQHLRERDRRRRWSGAEREEYGVSSP
ncbi:hypothetical protein BDV28DRAFT_143352 [Aspergillus coremiiformis]|uniref:Uncharacterized protein n=1 Tax=Aspergillus coremiiformis TaxID=138285 RepID=A0A5N6YUC1_9EURO|nr:hypothetical protein BDV28DRAFT_143352 [Aspergillus coremiiformis]